MLDRVRHRPSTALLAKLLTALLFAQLMLPVQAHSHLVRTDGMTIVMCTLQGPKSVQVTPEGAIVEQQLPSAAMQFSDLLKDFTPALALPSRLQIQVGMLTTQTESLPDVPAVPRRSPNSRAPPSA